jgi:hypothetical protein
MHFRNLMHLMLLVITTLPLMAWQEPIISHM